MCTSRITYHMGTNMLWVSTTSLLPGPGDHWEESQSQDIRTWNATLNNVFLTYALLGHQWRFQSHSDTYFRLFVADVFLWSSFTWWIVMAQHGCHATSYWTVFLERGNNNWIVILKMSTYNQTWKGFFNQKDLSLNHQLDLVVCIGEKKNNQTYNGLCKICLVRSNYFTFHC